VVWIEGKGGDERRLTVFFVPVCCRLCPCIKGGLPWSWIGEFTCKLRVEGQMARVRCDCVFGDTAA